MTSKRKRGRPMTAHNVSVTPEFRERPDIEKIGRVLISVAISRAKPEESNDGMSTLIERTRKGDAMT
ncbi:MAG: hypothetical protein HFJ05_00495 [Eubacterium sp.]|nr:hypothetical protein [Eubacterium sp.]